jgi:hypothetical protein
VDESAGGVDVTRIMSDDPRHMMTAGELDQRRCQRRFTSPGVMQTHFHREPLTEDFTPLIHGFALRRSSRMTGSAPRLDRKPGLSAHALPHFFPRHPSSSRVAVHAALRSDLSSNAQIVSERERG